MLISKHGSAGNDTCSHRFIRLVKLVALTVVISFAPMSSSFGDSYQYIISGYPATDESYPAESSATSLQTAAITAQSSETEMETRYRTWLESIGIAMRSDKFAGLFLIVR